MTRASDLIHDAYCLANIIDPRETPEGYEAAQGLDTLNAIIERWGSLGIYIPYFKALTVNVLANDAQYTVTPIITEVGEAHITDSSNVQSVLTVMDLKTQNLANYELVVGRPSKVFIGPITSAIQSGSNVFFYPTPDAAYTATIYAKQNLVELAYSDEITTLPKFYLQALQYQLAKNLSVIFSSVLTPAFLDEYNNIMSDMKAANAHDMSVQNSNPFYSYKRYRAWGTYVG